MDDPISALDILLRLEYHASAPGEHSVRFSRIILQIPKICILAGSRPHDEVPCYTQRSFDGKTDYLLNGTTERTSGDYLLNGMTNWVLSGISFEDVQRILIDIRTETNCRSRRVFGPPISIVDTTYHSPPIPAPSLSRVTSEAYSVPDHALLHPASRRSP